MIKYWKNINFDQHTKLGVFNRKKEDAISKKWKYMIRR